MKKTLKKIFDDGVNEDISDPNDFQKDIENNIGNFKEQNLDDSVISDIPLEGVERLLDIDDKSQEELWIDLEDKVNDKDTSLSQTHNNDKNNNLNKDINK